MKKFKIFKALFAAAALAFALPSCSDLSSGGSSAQVAPDGKVAVSLSLTEGYRSIISSLSLTGLKGTLTITPTDEGTTETVQPIPIADISAFDNGSTVAYLTADATYKFSLSVYKPADTDDGEPTPVLASKADVTKKITASDASVSITLVPVTDATVAVALNVSLTAGGSTAKASDFGVESVRATVYSDASLAEDKKVTDTDLQFTVANAKDASEADIDGSYVVSGEITTGATRWVKIELLADDAVAATETSEAQEATVLGSKTVAIYGIPTGEFSEADTTLTVAIKQYKATVVITSIDTVNTTEKATAKDLVLNNTAFSDVTETITYTAATKSTDGTTTTATYTAYVPYGTYKFTIGNGSGNVTNAKEVTVDADKILTSISVAWNDDHYEKNESNQVTTTAKAHYVNKTTESSLRSEIELTKKYKKKDGDNYVDVTQEESDIDTADTYASLWVKKDENTLVAFDEFIETASAGVEYEITVHYPGKVINEETGEITDTELSATLGGKLTLKEDSISSIAVKTKPTNLSYTVGNSINLSGLVLTLTYESTATENVTYTVTNEETGVAGNEVSFGLSFYSDSACTTSAGDDFTALQAGTYYVKVTYAEKTSDAFSVTISAGTFTASVTITEDGNAATGTYTVTFVNSEDTNSPISATAGTESDTTHVYSASGLAADKTYAVYIRGVDSGKTVTSAAPNVTCDYPTVYTLSGESAELSFDKDVIYDAEAANASKFNYMTITGGTNTWSSQLFDDAHTINALAMKSGRSYALKVKGVAAFTVFVKNGTSADRSFSYKVEGESITTLSEDAVVAKGSSVTSATVNTGSTDELTITFSNTTSNTVYIGYVVLYSTAQTIPVETVTISGAPTSAVLLATGTVQLSATVAPERATAKTLTWTSSAEEVATVDSTGKVTLVAAGTVTITATAPSGVKDEAEITVQAAEVKVSAIAVKDSSEATSGTVNAGDTLTLTATVTPEDASNKAVTWASSDETVATVAGGVVTAVAAGTATITATAADGSGVSGAYTLTVQAVTTISYFAGYDKNSTLSMKAAKSDSLELLTNVTDATYTRVNAAFDENANMNAAKSIYGLSCGNTAYKHAENTDFEEFFNVSFKITPAKAAELTNIALYGGCNKTSDFTVKVLLGETELASQNGSSNAVNLDKSLTGTSLVAGTEYTVTVKVGSVKSGKTFDAVESRAFTLANIVLTLSE